MNKVDEIFDLNSVSVFYDYKEDKEGYLTWCHLTSFTPSVAHVAQMDKKCIRAT